MRSFLLVLVVSVLSPTSARAFQLHATATGQPIRWITPVSLEASLEGGPLAEPDARQALSSAAATWSAALPGTAGVITVTRAPSSNTVRWVTTPDADFGDELIAITEVSHGADSGRIVQATVLLNAAGFSFTTTAAGCTTAYDLESVLAHELGHLLGLGHENGNPDATMFATVNACETSKRDLSDDDIAGVQTLYAISDVVTPPAPPEMPSVVAPAPVTPTPVAAPTPSDPSGQAISQSPLGCSVSPAGHQHTGIAALLLLTAAGLLARRRRTLIGAALALVVLSTAAQASTVHGLTLAELGSRAGVIVQGTVVGSHALRVGDRIYTDVEVQTAALWKGQVGARVIVRQLGGQVGDEVLSVEGQPVLAVGSEVVLFVRAGRDGAYRLVGMAQGAFQVVRAGGGVYAVRDESGLMLAGPRGLRAGGLGIVALATLAYLSSSP